MSTSSPVLNASSNAANAAAYAMFLRLIDGGGKVAFLRLYRRVYWLLLSVILEMPSAKGMEPTEVTVHERWGKFVTNLAVEISRSKSEGGRKAISDRIRQTARSILQSAEEQIEREEVSTIDLVAAAECAEFCGNRELQLRYADLAVSRTGRASRAVPVQVRGLVNVDRVEEALAAVDGAVSELGMKDPCSLLYGHVFYGFRRRGDFGAAQCAVERYFEACAAQLEDDPRVGVAILSNLEQAKANALIAGGLQRWEMCICSILERTQESLAFDGREWQSSDSPSTTPVVMRVYIECERSRSADAADSACRMMLLSVLRDPGQSHAEARIRQVENALTSVSQIEARNGTQFPRTLAIIRDHLDSMDELATDDQMRLTGVVRLARIWISQRKQRGIGP